MPRRDRMARRTLILFALALLAGVLLIPAGVALWIARGDPDLRPGRHRAYLESVRPATSRSTPNIVLVLADDLGYGDLSAYGSRAILTPHLDSLAREGAKLSAFHSASPVCSPSRFSFLTGRYPTRGFIHGMFFPSGTPRGLLVNSFAFPRGIRGIPPDEVTVAEALRARGYVTGMFGKWHLGDRSPHLPTEKGFDYFFGTYYSNDMQPYAYYRNNDVSIESPADQSSITRILTDEVLDFIERNSGSPFFVYYASPFPHHPVHAGEGFAGSSRGGPYGDCVEELDWSVGAIRRELADLGLERNTLFVFTSDNGPWYQGSAGPHRGRKANSFNGGQVVPFLASWPAEIPAGSEIDTPAMAIDLFPTFLHAAGIRAPTDRIIDGIDLMPLLRGDSAPPTDRPLFLVDGGAFVGVRTSGGLKYLKRLRSENSAFWMSRHEASLFDLALDPDESYNISARFPQESAKLARSVAEMDESRRSNPRGWLSVY